METQRTYWRLCSSCKRELAFEAPYYACSVSTCNRKRTGLTFCSVSCFEAHVPVLRHKEAWAEEQRAPTRAQWEDELAEEADAGPSAGGSGGAGAGAGGEPRKERRIVGVGAASAPALQEGTPREVLIVVSKLKAYVRARSGMNTSDGCVDVLSDIVRELCDGAIRKAAAEGRKTVMDRDF